MLRAWRDAGLISVRAAGKPDTALRLPSDYPLLAAAADIETGRAAARALEGKRYRLRTVAGTGWIITGRADR